ncbi:unnamed protein product [Trichobilharzia szidati]|nr:unnamed protein product [Trichobilharzia szidati]
MDIPLKCSSEEPGVLKEIDCYISPAMQRQILLLLYKNRESYQTLDSESIKEARIKPNLDLIELNIRDGRSCYVESTGEQTDTYLLRSNTVTFPRTLLGYFVNDECHFVPLNRDVLVLDTLKENAKVDRFNQSTDASTSDTVGPSAFVSARLRTADANALRGPMASRRKPADSDPDVIFLRQQTQAPWRPVRYKRYVPSEAFERRIPLLYPNDDMEHSRNHAIGPSQEEYVNSLLASVTPNIVDRSRLEPVKPPTLEELIQSIMVKAQLIRFNKLVMCVRERFKDPHSVTGASVLQHLPKIAILLRGWWVAKSEILYPPNSYSEHSGVPSALLIRARDYIMAVFHRGEHLTRKTISCMTKLPTVEATEMLKSLACKMSTPQKGCANHWEFHPTDYDFIKKHPDIVQQQQAAWEIRIRQLCTQLKLEQLVSDGTRRKSNSGRRTSESGSESEGGFQSLVSGVHVSSPGKHANNRKRIRQMSVCQTTDTEKSVTSPQPPSRKRIRTQSLSSGYSSTSLSPPSKLPRAYTHVLSPEFCAPTCPPRIKSPSPNRKVCEIPPSNTPESCASDNLSPTKEFNKQNQEVTFKPEPSSPRSSPPPTPTAEFGNGKVKLSPPSQNLSPEADENPGCTEFLNENNSINNNTDIPSTPSSSVNVNNIENGSDSEIPEALKNNSVNLVKNILNTQPIVALSELTKIYQQQLGNFDANSYSSLWKNNPPPPGSESEREMLKTHLLEALKLVGARRLVVRWPTVPTALEEEPLFVTQVAGQECGAVNESIAQFRDAILDLYESLPSFKMRDLQDKCDVFPPKGMSEKAMRAFIKQFCIFRHGRYFLRCTISCD